MLYRLVDDSGHNWYFGIAQDMAQLHDRKQKHSGHPEKAGKWTRMEVIADGLTEVEARSLETDLMVTGWKNGYAELNKTPSITPSTIDPTVLKNAKTRLINVPVLVLCPTK